MSIFSLSCSSQHVLFGSVQRPRGSDQTKDKKRTTLTLLIQNILVLVDYIFISCFNEWFLWNWLLFNFFLWQPGHICMASGQWRVHYWVGDRLFFFYSLRGELLITSYPVFSFLFFSRLLLFQVLLSHLSAPSPFFFLLLLSILFRTAGRSSRYCFYWTGIL